MGTKTNKEKDIDSDRPSTIRIIAGILVLLCTFPIFVYGSFGIHDLMQFPYEKMSFFEHIWGKLLVILVSGTIYLTLLGVMTIFLLIALRIWSGKREKTKHIIYPFPAVLTTEIADFYKVERADDQFLIFTTPSEIRGFLIGIGAAILCTGIFLFCKEIDNPYSEIYWPPFSGAFILAPFILLISQVFAHKRRFVLDRMNGTVTFPRHLFFPRCTVPFSKVIPGYSKGTMNLAFRFCFYIRELKQPYLFLQNMIPIGGHSMYSIWTRTARCRKVKFSTPTARRTSCAERRQVSQNRYIPVYPL